MKNPSSTSVGMLVPCSREKGSSRITFGSDLSHSQDGGIQWQLLTKQGILLKR